jgi:hypothetical protein
VPALGFCSLAKHNEEQPKEVACWNLGIAREFLILFYYCEENTMEYIYPRLSTHKGRDGLEY